ncbi:MAG: hypothetical protein HY905_26820 [Deltaproteobacteria bacterium]|nr:hypothetical protein [Deltaproteobacteria bacterium]
MRAGMSRLKWWGQAVTIVTFGCSGAPTSDQPDADALPADAETSDGEVHEVLDVSDSGVEDGSIGPEAADVRDVIPLPSTCGDRVIDPGEECDDGNRMNGDACDWECRAGPGSFEYPDPDPAVHPIEDTGVSVSVVPDGEFAESSGLAGFSLCRAGDGFALAYPAGHPILATRIQRLDRSGVPVGDPWERPEPFSLPTLELVASEGRLVLFSKQMLGALRAAEFDDSLVPVEDTHDVAGAPAEPVGLPLQSVAVGPTGFVAGYSLPSDAGGGWLLHLVDPDATAAGPTHLFRPVDSGTFFSQILDVPGGFVVTDGFRVVGLDEHLDVVGWTGVVSGPGLASPGTGLETEHVARTEDGLLFFWGAYPVAPARLGNIWAAGLGFDGTMTMPPRIVLPEVVAGTGNELRVTYGPAGVAVVFYGLEHASETEGILLFNTDRFGNARSAPGLVFSMWEGADPGAPVDIAADDEGYGLAVRILDRSSSTYASMFRRFVPGP